MEALLRNKLLRSFLSGYGEDQRQTVIKLLCILGVQTLQHLTKNAAAVSVSDIEQIVLANAAAGGVQRALPQIQQQLQFVMSNLNELSSDMASSTQHQARALETKQPPSTAVPQWTEAESPAAAVADSSTVAPAAGAPAASAAASAAVGRKPPVPRFKKPSIIFHPPSSAWRRDTGQEDPAAARPQVPARRLGSKPKPIVDPKIYPPWWPRQTAGGAPPTRRRSLKAGRLRSRSAEPGQRRRSRSRDSRGSGGGASDVISDDLVTARYLRVQSSGYGGAADTPAASHAQPATPAAPAAVSAVAAKPVSVTSVPQPSAAPACGQHQCARMPACCCHCAHVPVAPACHAAAAPGCAKSCSAAASPVKAKPAAAAPAPTAAAPAQTGKTAVAAAAPPPIAAAWSEPDSESEHSGRSGKSGAAPHVPASTKAADRRAAENRERRDQLAAGHKQRPVWNVSHAQPVDPWNPMPASARKERGGTASYDQGAAAAAAGDSKRCARGARVPREAHSVVRERLQDEREQQRALDDRRRNAVRAYVDRPRRQKARERQEQLLAQSSGGDVRVLDIVDTFAQDPLVSAFGSQADAGSVRAAQRGGFDDSQFDWQKGVPRFAPEEVQQARRRAQQRQQLAESPPAGAGSASQSQAPVQSPLTAMLERKYDWLPRTPQSASGSEACVGGGAGEDEAGSLCLHERGAGSSSGGGGVAYGGGSFAGQPAGDSVSMAAVRSDSAAATPLPQQQE